MATFPQTPRIRADQAPAVPTHVVGIGSSAGGIAALRALLRGLPDDLPNAYVVAQHMSPHQDSHLVELLARETELPVTFAVDGSELVAGHIVVAQSNSDVRVVDLRVQVASPGSEPGPSPSIDALFNSLAESLGSNAVGVILSGTGSDGVQGAESIRAVGGVVIAEEPTIAAYESMPQAVIDSGATETVLNPSEVGAELRRLANAVTASDDASRVGSDDIDAILAGVHSTAGIDFSGYKRSTVGRQIARRQAVRQATTLAGYRALALDDPLEMKALAAALLVTVTSFFRDPDAWRALEERLRASRAPSRTGTPLRIWVPGCATGEEAYTAAMVVAAALGDPVELCRRLKVFATDLNEVSLEAARRGRYAATAFAAMPDRFRERWVQPGEMDGETATGEIDARLRECIVFARHNVAFDPPFPNLDLICLRNTMIYLQPQLRERVLRLCHFGLAPDGLLMLGASERLDGNDRLFVQEDADHHWYRRRASSSREMLPTVGQEQPQVGSAPAASAVRHDVTALQDLLISRLIPAGLVVDGDDCVIRVIGDVTRWCAFPEGSYSNRITALLREPLRRPVAGLLMRARRTSGDRVEVDVALGEAVVRCGAVLLDSGSDAAAAVLFVEPPAQAVAGSGPDPLQAVDGESTGEPSSELASTRRALEATVDELGAANERLRFLNEELAASSEELQASSEELQAANEELAASNEELSTMNAELQIRAELLSQANIDLNNIQSSLTSGMVIVDRDLSVIRYTPLAVRLFSLIDSDVGRPLDQIPTSISIAGLAELLRAAVTGSATSMQEVHGPAADFLVSCQPYIDLEGQVVGAIVVITDITEMSIVRRAQVRAVADQEAITNAVQEALWLQLPDGTVRLLNPMVVELFGVDGGAHDIDSRQLLNAIHPDDRANVEQAWVDGRLSGPAAHPSHSNYRVVRPDGSLRWVTDRCEVVSRPDGRPEMIIHTVRDVTDLVDTAEALERERAVTDAILANPLVSLILLDEQGRIVRANACFDAMLGYANGELVGTHLDMLIVGSRGPDDTTLVDRLTRSGDVSRQFLLTAADGSSRHVTMTSTPLEGASPRRVVVIQDITTMRSLYDALAEQLQFDPQTGAMNRSNFRDQLSLELDRSQRRQARVAVMWIDLDDFKAINDQYGHEVGDVVLREAVARLRAVTRAGNHVGRAGGDEFAIMIRDIDVRNNLDGAIDRVLAALNDPIQIADAVVYSSGSIGVAISPDDGVTADQLLHNADTAMYVAKRAGGNQRAYFRAEMNRAAGDRATMRQDLEVAVRQGDFQMFYQPIVATDDFHVTAVEALLRWHRGDVFVPAHQFVAAAGETNQLRVIGRQVLSMVDQDMHQLAQVGLIELPISINLSVPELEERPLVDALLAWQPVGGFGRILIEVTESSQLADGGKAAEVLRLLVRLGAHLVVDDFGTGYSNLETLERMRPAIVKIDRSMLTGVRKHLRGTKVLAAAVQLAHALGARVVIEGVETVDQHELAAQLGAEEVQGNLFATPMPVGELVAWLGAWRPGECSSLLNRIGPRQDEVDGQPPH